MDKMHGNVTDSVLALSAVTRKKQVELAASLGVSQAAVAQRLTGKTRWTLQDVAVLAREFGVSTDQLMAGPWSWLGVDDPRPDTWLEQFCDAGTESVLAVAC